MDDSEGKRKSKISLSPVKSEKSRRSFRSDLSGVVGLGIVAALASPIPIVVSSSAKAAANFRGAIDLDSDSESSVEEEIEVDESSESYTCVISHIGDNSIRKRVYFDGKLSCVEDYDCDGGDGSSVGVFSASPAFIGELNRDFWTSDFLNSCFLCKKLLHGLDIFMYRGEKAFCSCDCRDKHMSDGYKEKCSSEAMKTPLDYSVSPCSSPQVFLAGVVAA